MRSWVRPLSWGAVASVLCSAVTAYGTYRVAGIQRDPSPQLTALEAENARLQGLNNLLAQTNQSYRIDMIEKRLDKLEAWQIATTERQDLRQLETNKELGAINMSLAAVNAKLESILKGAH